MKKSSRILAVVLSLMMVFSCAVPGFASYDPKNAGSVTDKAHSATSFEKYFWNATDKLMDVIVKSICAFIPDQKTWGKNADDYSSDGFMPGDDEFLSEPADGARWSLGYSEASILEGQDVLDGNHYVGGMLTLNKKVATEVYDDLKVRTVALNDNSGRGSAVFAVIDGFGISNTDVRAIRQELESFSKENNVKSINISVLHQHSAVDTLGLNGNVLEEVVKNPWKNLFGKNSVSGRNDEYMRNLYDKTEQTIKEAVTGEKNGKLYYGKIDMSEFMTDKRDPQVLDNYFERFRFVPSDGSKETWFTTSCVHLVGNGAAGTVITGDYAYYMEQAVNEKYNANFALVLGAEQATTQDKSTLDTENLSRLESVKVYGEALADRLNAISNEKELSPVLNIRSEQIKFNISNCILLFAGKEGLINHQIVKTGFNKYQEVSELGYMELGDDVAVFLAPGETTGETYYGGACPASKSWSGKDWNYAPLETKVEGGRDVIVFGLENDMVGYIIPDNDYMPILYPNNKSLEVVSLGKTACSEMVKGYEQLLKNAYASKK